LNPRAEAENAITKEDLSVFLITKGQFAQAYASSTGRAPSDDELLAFLQRTNVVELCVEVAQAHEAVAMMLLHRVSAIPPDLFWDAIQSQALTFCKERWSVTFDGLQKHNARFLKTDSADAVSELVDVSLRTVFQGSKEFPVGKDVLLLRDFPEAGKLAVVELFRFDASCRHKLTYSEAGIRFQRSQQPIEVICRWATMGGLKRYIESKPELFKGDEVVIIPANGIDDVEETPCAKAHAVYLHNILNRREKLLSCLHCGRPISEEWVDCVELDDEETAPNVGAVHHDCLRPIDRILGRTQIPFFKDRQYLKGFNFELWLPAIISGQRLFHQLFEARFGDRTPVMCWGGKLRNGNGMYCVAIELSDGTIRHVTTRGILDRYRQAKAIDFARRLNESYQKSRSEGSPQGYSSESWSSGRYEDIVPMMAADEKFLECVNARVVPYSEHIARRYVTAGSYYAPVMILRHAESGAILNIDDAVLVCTDPFAMGKNLENWTKLFGDLSAAEIEILATDEEFDEFMEELEADEMFVLLNPLFGSKGELLSGIRLIPMKLLEAYGTSSGSVAHS
jgi:hypothetical protein